MRKEYPLELKKRVVARVETGELTPGTAAQEYGLRAAQVRRWVEQFRGTAESGSGEEKGVKAGSMRQIKILEAELKRLRRELEKAEAERDFLKKAASYFARATP